MPYTGQPVKRVEDPHLVTGQGSFVDDVQLPDMLHAAILAAPMRMRASVPLMSPQPVVCQESSPC
jgi:CO/xanthine dehydrogenase Mo-binding subunit